MGSSSSEHQQERKNMTNFQMEHSRMNNIILILASIVIFSIFSCDKAEHYNEQKEKIVIREIISGDTLIIAQLLNDSILKGNTKSFVLLELFIA